MANAYSILNNFDAPLYSPDFQSISKALTYKQNKLDMNRAALDQMYDQITDLDILKEQDKDYANKRISAVTKLVNQYANQDLSNDGLVKNLQSDLTQILDDNVKNAVYSTAVYRAEEAEWDKLKEDSPEKYADQNYWFAHKGFNNYMSDGKVGSKYKGGGGIIEYQDVAAKINKNLPKMLKDKGVNVQLNEYGEYYWDKTKTKDISEADVMSAVQASIGDKDWQQLQINANYNYKNHSDTDMIKMYDNQKDSKIKNVNAEIKKLDKALATNIPSSYKDSYKAQKSQLESYRNSLTTGKTPSRGSIENSLYNDQFFAPFKDTYSVHQVTERSLIKNDVSLKQLDFEIDLAKMDRKHDQAKEILALENMYSNKGASTNSKVVGGGGITAEGTATPEDIIPVETTLEAEEVKPHYSQLQDATDGLMKGLTAQGVLPDMYTASEDRDQAMSIITTFNGIPQGKSADGTKDIYTIGFENGKSKTLELTPAQAEDMMELNKSMKVLSDTENRMVQEIDSSIQTFKTDLIKADDVDSNNLLGFNYRVKTTSNGDKKLVPVGTDATFKFGTLIQKAKKDPESLSDDERETLDLYVGLDTVGSLAYNEGNKDNSVTVDASQAWLQRKSLEYTNGGQFLSHKPNDYNIYNPNKVQQVFVTEDGTSQFATADTVDENTFNTLMGAATTIAGFALSPEERNLIPKPGDTDLSALPTQKHKEAYKKVMDEFYDGKNMLIVDNDTKVLRVEGNIEQLVNTMVNSGKDISTYNFTDVNKESIYRANSDGVGRTFTNMWANASDATAADLERHDLEVNNEGRKYDSNASVVSFSKVHENLSSTLKGFSDDLEGSYKLPQQQGLVYTKESNAGKLLMEDLDTYFKAQDQSREFGDKVILSYMADGSLKVYGDISEAGGTKEQKEQGTSKDNAIVIPKHQIPSSVPKVDVQETTLFNTASKSPDSRYTFLETQKQIPTLVDYTMENVQEGSIDRQDFEQFVTNLSNNGMVFSFEPNGNTYASVLKLPYQSKKVDESGTETATSHTPILLDDTGLTSVQEKGAGSVRNIMEVGAKFDNLLNLYGEQILVGILDVYLKDLERRQTNQ